jgi:cytochrome P450
MVSLLLPTGHETTANMFPLAVIALLHNQAQLDALRAGDSLWPGAVEELLRHPTVIHSGIRRIATEDVELSGVASEGGGRGGGVACRQPRPVRVRRPRRLRHPP